MEPSYDNSFNGTNPGGMNPGVGDGAVPQMDANAGGGVVSQMNMGVDGQVMPQMNGDVGDGQMPQMDQVPQMNPVMQTNPGGMDTMQQMGSETMNPGVMNPMQQINLGMMNPGEMNPMQQMNTEGMNPGGFPENSMPVSSGTGDVILGDDGKKGKKWLIVVGLVIAIAVIGLLVWLFVLSSGGMGGQSSFNSGNRIETFDRFANYIISGNEEGSFPDTQYDRNAIYSIESALVEHDEAYFENANKLFNSFLGTIDLGSDDFISKVVDEYSIKWEIIDTLGKNRLYDEEEFVKYYIDNGEKSTYDQINSELNALRSIKGGKADEISEYYANYEMLLLKQINTIERNGCIKNYQIDYACVNAIDEIDFRVDDEVETILNKNKADQIVNSLIAFFVQDLWIVRSDLNV